MSEQVSGQRLVSGTRDGRYGEVLLGHVSDRVRIEVYNSYLLNDCPQELWGRLSPESIAASHAASFAVLNGPRHWMMDGIGKVANVEPVLRDFGGIQMRLAATIELEGVLDRGPYREITVNRGAAWYFDAGSPVYELVDGAGRTFVLQAYCTAIDPSLDIEGLEHLGKTLALPDGWSFRTRLLDAELVVDTTQRAATVLQDELENTYTLAA